MEKQPVPQPHDQAPTVLVAQNAAALPVWEAPDPATRVPSAEEQVVMEAPRRTIEDRIRRLGDRLEKRVIASNERKDAEKRAARLATATGDLALTNSVERPSFRQIWREGGNNTAARLGHVMRRGVYNATTIGGKRNSSPFSEARPYGGTHGTLSPWIANEVKLMGKDMANSVKDKARVVSEGNKATAVEKVRTKAGGKEIYAQLYDKGLRKDGSPTTKDLSRKADKLRYQAAKLKLKADYKQVNSSK